jgi:hypothetical protein
MKYVLSMCFTLCLIFVASLSLAAPQTPGNNEVKQIMAAAKAYARAHGSTEDKFDYQFARKAGNYALVNNFPKPRYRSQFEGAEIILKKVHGQWVPQDMGTGLEADWEKKAPGLFK